MTDAQKRRAADLLRMYAGSLNDILYPNYGYKELEKLSAECYEVAACLDAETQNKPEKEHSLQCSSRNRPDGICNCS